MAESAALLRPRLHIDPSVGKFNVLPNRFVEKTIHGKDGEVRCDEGEYVIHINRSCNNSIIVANIIRAFGLEGKTIKVEET